MGVQIPLITNRNSYATLSERITSSWKGLSAKETHYSYDESCPETDTEETLPITRRVNLNATKKGEVIRKLHVDEPLRIIRVDKEVGTGQAT